MISAVVYYNPQSILARFPINKGLLTLPDKKINAINLFPNQPIHHKLSYIANLSRWKSFVNRDWKTKC